MSNAILFLRAQTAMHPGAGTSVGAIDLPIQRERFTGWPIVQGSSIKGVLRDRYRASLVSGGDASTSEAADNHKDVTTLFGADTNHEDHAGAVSVTDARVLAFPVRSAKGVFAWATCPAAVARLLQDLAMVGHKPPITHLDDIADDRAALPQPAQALLLLPQNRLILEDLLFTLEEAQTKGITELAKWLMPRIGDGAPLHNPENRLVLVSDNAFTHYVRHTTELVTRIRLEYKTKHVVKGALFTLELIPAETLLYSALLIESPRGGSMNLKPAEMCTNLHDVLNDKLLQIGGEETTGKGWCRARIDTGVAK